MSNELWSKWSDIHGLPDQQKRIASAKKSACTPVSLDPSTCTGIFKGSSGTHTTSLDHCSCVDFNRRKLPCKHMYRLAMELGLLQSDFSSDKSAIVEPHSSARKKHLADTIKVVETLSENQQWLLLEIARNVSSKNPTVRCKSTPDLYSLVEHNLIEFVPDYEPCLAKYKKGELVTLANSLGLTPDMHMLKMDLINYILEKAANKLDPYSLSYAVVQVCEDVSYRRVHMYLHRKLESECYYDGDLHDIPLLQTILPDDIVTDLLIQYGYYTPPNV